MDGITRRRADWRKVDVEKAVRSTTQEDGEASVQCCQETFFHVHRNNDEIADLEQVNVLTASPSHDDRELAGPKIKDGHEMA